MDRPDALRFLFASLLVECDRALPDARLRGQKGTPK
jgi:hypothetical protein